MLKLIFQRQYYAEIRCSQTNMFLLVQPHIHLGYSDFLTTHIKILCSPSEVTEQYTCRVFVWEIFFGQKECLISFSNLRKVEGLNCVFDVSVCLETRDDMLGVFWIWYLRQEHPCYTQNVAALAVALAMGVTHIFNGLMWLGRPKRRKNLHRCQQWQ